MPHCFLTVSTRAWQKALPVSFLTVSIWFWAASPAFCLTSLMTELVKLDKLAGFVELVSLV